MSDLINEIKMYVDRGVYPFHMPGHKRNKAFMPPDLLSLDITEIYGMDNLHDPKAIINDAQKYAAEIWDADSSFFLVNGSSCGVISAVMSVCGHGDAIIAARNSHLSFYNALALSGAMPVYVAPYFLDCGLAGGINPDDIEKAFCCNENVKAVYVTSPTYEGFVSDIARIAEITHSHNKILIVDEAHGAHFAFSAYFPESAIKLGADIVVQSLHKTLPTLGQSAILHVKGDGVDLHRLKRSLSMMQTTSPSYILISVMQNAIKLLSENKRIFSDYTYMLECFRGEIANLRRFRLLGRELRGSAGIFDVDLGKLVFITNFDGLWKILREKYKIEIEAESQGHIIAMTSVADTKVGFDGLKRALTEMDASLKNECPARKTPVFNLPEMAITPWQAWNGKKIAVSPKEAKGKISAENIAPYPPGVPLATMGEIITDEIIECVLNMKKDEIYIIL